MADIDQAIAAAYATQQQEQDEAADRIAQALLPAADLNHTERTASYAFGNGIDIEWDGDRYRVFWINIQINTYTDSVYDTIGVTGGLHKLTAKGEPSARGGLWRRQLPERIAAPFLAQLGWTPNIEKD